MRIFLVRFADDEAAFLVQAKDASMARTRFVRSRDQAGLLSSMNDEADGRGETLYGLVSVEEMVFVEGVREISL